MAGYVPRFLVARWVPEDDDPHILATGHTGSHLWGELPRAGGHMMPRSQADASGHRVLEAPHIAVTNVMMLLTRLSRHRRRSSKPLTRRRMWWLPSWAQFVAAIVLQSALVQM